MSTVIPFCRPASARQGSWSQQELAEFYRVEAALLRAGLSIASEHGLSDEGEPWFVFCRPDGDAIIHFAKIDGSYLIASEVLDRPVRGADFRTLIDQIARLHPHLLPIPAVGAGTTLVVHPAALLAALVAAAALSLSSEDAHASPLAAWPDDQSGLPASDGAGSAHGQPRTTKATEGGGGSDRGTDRKQIEAIVLSAMIFAAEAMAADHEASGAELGFEFADQARGAVSHTTQSDATAASSALLGSGGATMSAVQPVVLTAQGSGTSPNAISHGSPDSIAATSRIDLVPAARTSFPGDLSRSPASENQHLSQGFGSDVAVTGTSAESSAAAKLSGRQASPSERSENLAAAVDGPGPDPIDQRGGPASASTVEPASHARSAHAASPDPFDVGTGVGQPTWVRAASHTVASQLPAAAAPRDVDERGHSRQAEDAVGNNPKVDQTDPGNGRANGTAQDRGSQADAAAENNPKVDQGGHGDGHASRVSQGRGAQGEAAAENNRQIERAGGAAETNGHERSSRAEASAENASQVEPTSRGSGNASAVARDQGSPTEALSENSAQVQQTGHDNGHVNGDDRERGSQGKAAAANDLPLEQAGSERGHAGVVGQNPGPSPEAATADRSEIDQAGRAKGQENANNLSSRPQNEAAAGNGLPIVQAAGGNGQSHGSHSQAEAVAQRETGSDTSATGHGRSPSSNVDLGAAVQAETESHSENDRQANRANGHGSAPAETSDHRGPDVHGSGEIDTAPGQGKPGSSGEARWDAAPATQAHASIDREPVTDASNQLTAAQVPSGKHDPTDRGASGHDATADHVSASANGRAQGVRPFPEQVRGDPSEHDSSHDAMPSNLSAQPNGDLYGSKEHGLTPKNAAAASSSNVHAEGAGSQAAHPREGTPLQEQTPDAQPVAPATADHDPLLDIMRGQDRASGSAEAENHFGRGTPPAAGSPNASPGSEHVQETPALSYDGDGKADVGATPPVHSQAAAHRLDDSDLSVPSRSPSLTAASQAASPPQAENTPTDLDRGQVDDGAPINGRADSPTYPVTVNQPPLSSDKGAADQTDDHSPLGQPGSAVVSSGASGHIATASGRPSPPPAAIDADGNLVFHTDSQQEPIPPALPPRPEDTGTHHAVGLIGMSDQVHVVHDLYHHT